MGIIGKQTAYFHLPGLFEFYDFYRVFLRVHEEHRDYFNDWCAIGSIYGAPEDCLWGGGRTGVGEFIPNEVLSLMEEHKISARLTFSNSLLIKDHLGDKKCNLLCDMFSKTKGIKNGVIVHSDLLREYLTTNFPNLYLISSTTKVLDDFEGLSKELARPQFKYVVPDFRLNKSYDELSCLSATDKDKVEFLCNECCWVNCGERKACYENVSRKNLGEVCEDHICHAPGGNEGYRFSKAMENPMFISVEDIKNKYMPLGFSNFKIEGRGLGSAVVLECLLYYLVKPECQLRVREEIYLDSMLDLF